MKTYTDEELKNFLLDYADCPNDEQLISHLIGRIRTLGSEAQVLFENWYENRVVPEFDCKGVTSDFLRKSRKMENIGILLAYDWLCREPDYAAFVLKKPVIIHKNIKKKK